MMDNPKSQVSDSSTPLLSEPPDIKKWFSSYTYQSPELDSIEPYFCFSTGVNDDERRLCVQDNGSEREGKCPDFAAINQSVSCKSNEDVQKLDFSTPADVEVPVYDDSLSLPSEVPDITKWFPSYVYDSPELDTADFDVSLSSGYSLKEGHNLKELPVTEGKNVTLSSTEETARHSQVQDNTTSVHKDCSERSNSSPKKFPATTYNQETSREELNICNDILDKPDACAKTRAEDLLPTLQEEYINLIRSPAKKIRAGENDSRWISLDRKPRKEDCRSIKKPQRHHVSVPNQFNSIKNTAIPMINKENSPVKPLCSADEQNGVIMRREVLKERTNFDSSHVLEAAGKWRCPQKNKPHTGPPLKQLRLERWVHKR